MEKKTKIDEGIASLLKSIVDQFEIEERSTRERQIRKARKLKLYWNNLNLIYWNEAAKDYRIAPQPASGDDQAFYDRPVNVFKAFLETIIAALSIQVPAIVCIPHDAQNPMDLSTAKAGNKIGEMQYKDNNAIFLWLYALYVYCTEQLIAMYHYPEDSDEYGTYDEKIYEDEETEAYVCPNCGDQIAEELLMQDDEVEDLAPPTCLNCGEVLDPTMETTKISIPTYKRTEQRPKTKICMEVYGSLYVQIPNSARKQKDVHILALKYETHYANVLEKYEHLKGKIPKGGNVSSRSISGSYDPHEEHARQNVQYGGDNPENVVTVREYWLRPAAFNTLPEGQEERVRAKFPDGVKLVLANEECAEYCPEKLDDRWTLAVNPLSDYLTYEPLGELLVNIQDITNDLISLTLQTIEHGITELFADPAVVDFNARSQMESTPGMITRTKPQGANKNISDAFFSANAAALSPEVFSFYRIVQELGQFVSGALPSVFGGTPTGKTSQTAAEYRMSQSMALKRLQTPWKMLTTWWGAIFGKTIPQHIEEMVTDDRYVERTETGFMNVFIKKAEVAGRIGRIEVEGSDRMPISDDEKSALIMELMQLNNMEVMEAFVSKENLPSMRKIVRLPEFRLPGEDDRQKQLEEIQLLLESQPQLEDPDPIMAEQAIAAGQQLMPMEVPSIRVDPLVDNHAVEAEVCRNWAVSDVGRQTKIENPSGYMNVLLHMKEHMGFVSQQMMAQQQMAQQNNPDKGKDGSNKPKGESNVSKESVS